MDRERGRPDGRRRHLPHLLHDQAHRLGRPHAALRAGHVPAARPGAPLHPRVADPAGRRGAGRRLRHPGEAGAPDEHARRPDAHDRDCPAGCSPATPSTTPSARRGPRWGTAQTLESVTALLAEHPLKFHPGTHWNYGLSTDIVGRLVEILSGSALRRVPAARALRAPRHGRHRVLRPRGLAAPVRRLLPVPPGQHPRLMEGPFANGFVRPRVLPLGRRRARLDDPRLRRLLPDAGQRRPARRPAGPRAARRWSS